MLRRFGARGSRSSSRSRTRYQALTVRRGRARRRRQRGPRAHPAAQAHAERLGSAARRPTTTATQAATADELEGLAARVRATVARLGPAQGRTQALNQRIAAFDAATVSPALVDAYNDDGAPLRAEPRRDAARHRREPRRLRPAPDPAALDARDPGAAERYAPPLVAVLGGGQLGRMLGLAGIPLGLGFRFLDPSPAAPAQSVGDAGRRRARRRARAAARPSRARRSSPTSGKACPPTRRGCSRRTATPSTRRRARSRSSQDRLVEKTTFRELGIPVRRVRRGRRPRRPARGGRDDRAPGGAEDPAGRLRRQGPGRAPRARATSSRRSTSCAAGAPLILEAFVPFDRELSVLAVRKPDGDVRVLAAGREPPRGRHPARVASRRRRTPTTTLQAIAERLRATAARALRLRRCARGRAVRGRRHARWRTRWRPACTTPGTGRSRAR